MGRLPWTRFHSSVVVGLGVSWIHDGLEIQLVAANGHTDDLYMDASQVGLTGTIYLLGLVVGALVFERLTDRIGRKKLFILTLAIYLVGSGIAGLSPTMWFLWAFRFIPSKYRGRVDIAVNCTYWGGVLIGAVASSWLLNPANISSELGMADRLSSSARCWVW